MFTSTTLILIFLILSVVYLIINLKLSSGNIKYDGQLIVSVSEDGPKVFSLELDGDPEDLIQKKSVTFQVMPTKPSIEESL